MKLLIQRVLSAHVEVDHQMISSIGPGFLVFIGVTHTDTQEQAVKLAQKMVHLRIFGDAEGKINRSLMDVKGEVLIVSQFTLYADCLKGRRPSFIDAASPELANTLYEFFIQEVRKLGVSAKGGQFGAKMHVALINDGPFTVSLEV